MRFVVFGLTISSSWGNGHATVWRGLCKALGARGHRVTFFERDVPYYARHRDRVLLDGCDLRLYSDWDEVRCQAAQALDDADVAILSSFCPDAQAASVLMFESRVWAKAYYDLDTPVTIDETARGARPAYVPEGGLAPFDVVLSFGGGRALEDLKRLLGARRAVTLYGSVDPDIHRRVPQDPRKRGDLSYLGTYAISRQPALEQLFLEPARQRPDARFILAGSQYPANFPWTSNVFYLWHLPPGDHASFFSSSRWTLNLTRGPMAAYGYCAPVRLFEAAACATPIICDAWDGLEQFFEPGDQVVVARDTADVLAALEMGDAEREGIAQRARERALACHTSAIRATELEQVLGTVGEPDRGRPARGTVVGVHLAG